MPPKGKKATKPKVSESSEQKAAPATATPPREPPKTVYERALQAYYASNPHAEKLEKESALSLTAEEHTAVWHAEFARNGEVRNRLSAKAQRDAWRYVNEHNLPVRYTVRHKPTPEKWGRDRFGKNIGDYTLAEAEARSRKQQELSIASGASRRFRDRREAARLKCRNVDTGEEVVLTKTDVEEERARRGTIAALRKDLFGKKMGAFEQDPAWDDVVPVPQDEPEGALSAIAYPDDYAEAVSYLRAVMIMKEYSQRCLQLTEHIIGMNPAHYTVWLYRAAIVFGLKLPIPKEIEWLNNVALENLKNYQIWHHRHLLVENYYPTIAADPEKIAAFAASERAFITTILAEDTKNYHVWSYRTWLVGKLGVWGDAAELAAVATMIDDDVRNNSAWSHRFFVVFSDPAHTTRGAALTEHDPKVPQEIIDREVQYAMQKTRLAPQNQSAWNYLRGVLTKGGRQLASMQEFVSECVRGIGEGEGKEDVKSTHALELLADIYAEKGEKDKADLCLQRLGEKWDPIRVGYWEWKRKCLKED